MTHTHLDNNVVQDWGNITHVASGEHKVEDLALVFVSVCRSAPFRDGHALTGFEEDSAC